MRSLALVGFIWLVGCELDEETKVTPPDVHSDCTPQDVPEDVEHLSDPSQLELEWDYVWDEGYGVVSHPAIGQLTDDNGDGQVDGADVPDVVFTTLDHTLVALHGDGSGVIFEKEGYYANSSVSIGDVDGDGHNDIVAPLWDVELGAGVAALDATGERKWTHSMFAQEGRTVIADLEGDGIHAGD